MASVTAVRRLYFSRKRQITGQRWNHSRPLVTYSAILRAGLSRLSPANRNPYLMRFAFPRPSFWCAAILGCSIVPFLYGLGAYPHAASAATGPFAEFPGRWSGTGKIQVRSSDTEKTERTRCDATYRLRGSHEIDLELKCKSDSYDFDLTGEFEATATNRIAGRWTERSRNIGGVVIGAIQGDRMQIHVESSAFAADLYMVTRNRRQSVNIDSQGGGQTVKASITLRRH
jgi:hypothetical protein